VVRLTSGERQPKMPDRPDVQPTEQGNRRMQALGQLIQNRRETMGMSLSVLSREMGGSPGASFLSKVESARADVSANVAVRLANARHPRFR